MTAPVPVDVAALQARLQGVDAVVSAARRVVGVMNVGLGHRLDWQDKEVLRELASALRALDTPAPTPPAPANQEPPSVAPIGGGVRASTESGGGSTSPAPASEGRPT